MKRAQPSPTLRLGLDHRKLDRGKRDLLRLELRAVADQAPARLAVVDDLVAVDLDPGAQLVRLAERILAAELVEVGKNVRRRCVVVRDGELERMTPILSSASNGSHVIAVAEASMRIAANNTGRA